jgi:hypothetical protein
MTMMDPGEYMVKAIEMESKAAGCHDASATALYQELAGQWRSLYDEAMWRDSSEVNGARAIWD